MKVHNMVLVVGGVIGLIIIAVSLIFLGGFQEAPPSVPTISPDAIQLTPDQPVELTGIHGRYTVTLTQESGQDAIVVNTVQSMMTSTVTVQFPTNTTEMQLDYLVFRKIEETWTVELYEE